MKEINGTRAICYAVALLAALWTHADRSRASDTVFFVVRHAEKVPGNGDVPLSADGEKRAEQLMQMLEHFKIDAIYHTDVLRSKRTAQPLATKLDISPTVYADPTQNWINGVITAQQGKKVLIVAHSDTVHEIVGRLTGTTIPPIGEHFDNLFIVVISGAEKSMVHLRYGEAN